MNNYNVEEIQKIIKSDISFWNKTRIDIFDILLECSPEDKCWQRNDVPKALNLVTKQIGIQKNYALSEINTILKYADNYNIFNISDALLPFTKKFRHSVFLLSQQDIKYLGISEKIVFFIWSDYLHRKFSVDDLMLPFVCCTLHDGGIGSRHIIKNIHRIRLCDIMDNLEILLPLKPWDNSSFCNKLPVINSAKLILSKVMRGRRNNASNEYLFLPNITKKENRKLLITQLLEDQYKALTRKMKIDASEIPPFSTFLRVLPQKSLRLDIPPFFHTLTASPSLPATQKWNSELSYFGKATHNIAINKTKKIHYALTNNQSNLPHIVQPDPPSRIFSPHVWDIETRELLKDLRTTISKYGIKKLKDISNREDLIEIKKSYMERADKIADRGSAIHLAVEWTIDYIINYKVEAESSFGTYHSKYFTAGILRFPGAHKFSMLTSDEHRAAIKSNLKSRDISGDGASHVVCNYFSIYCLANRIGYIKNIDFSLIINAFNLSKRTIVLWPSKYDAYMQRWRDMNTFDTDLLATAADLSYYGNLREVESLSLRVGDIIHKGRVCYLVIRKSKTDNSPRIIPYHLLAPIKNVKFLLTILNERKKIAPNDPNLPLFGPKDSNFRYSEESFLIALRFGLKKTINNGFVPHMLRHCFTNNLIIKMTAISNPVLLNLIPDANHEIYRAENIQRLKEWIYNKADDNKLGMDHNILWYSAKLLGHSTPEEGLYTYCHVFEYVIESYYVHLNKIIDDTYPITKEAAALLLPNMANEKSLKNKYIPGMTISEALSLSLENI